MQTTYYLGKPVKAKTTYYKIRVVNGDFWQITEDELECDEEFDTLHEVRNAITKFLDVCRKSDIIYNLDDIEVIEFSIIENKVDPEELWL